MIAATRLAIGLAVAAGLAAGAVTDLLLASVGDARVTGVQVGEVAAPLLALVLSAPVRRALSANAGMALAVFGAAWTLAPLIDQHATGAVVVAGAVPDVLHHLAGWPALLAGARLGQRPRATFTS